VCVCDYCKSNRPILLKLGIIIGPTSWKNWLTGGGDPVADHFSTSLTIAEWGILGEWFISISHSHRPYFMTLSEMTDADKLMNPQRFRSDPA